MLHKTKCVCVCVCVPAGGLTLVPATLHKDASGLEGLKVIFVPLRPDAMPHGWALFIVLLQDFSTIRAVNGSNPTLWDHGPSTWVGSWGAKSGSPWS